ncbi:hypothetical protein MMC07_004391 [Pseudocyphellaria aurata]|nr:hypothetical protein [Pseudocyphellaria aurata]
MSSVSKPPIPSPPVRDAPLELENDPSNVLSDPDPETPQQQPLATTAPPVAGTDAAAVAAPTAGPDTILSKVEAVIESVVDGMLHKQPHIAIPIRVKKKPQQRPTGVASSSSSLWLPATAALEVPWTRVLARGFINDGILPLFRNVYYKDPTLFKSQTVVNRYIDILAYSLGVQRAALNITAAAKGLVAGKFTVTRKDGTVSSEWSGTATMLIDDVEDILEIDKADVAWVLVVEKEAKGYPDLSTRAFLRHLSISASSSPDQDSPPPIYALMDFDPDGISILSIYKHGSWTLSHENANHNVRSIRWLGLQSSDLVHSTNHESDGPDSNGSMGPTSSSNSTSRESLLRLSLRDRRKATGMLKRDPFLLEADDDARWSEETGWRRELQVMLVLGYKAEMELLGEREGGVEAWLERKLKLASENERG